MERVWPGSRFSTSPLAAEAVVASLWLWLIDASGCYVCCSGVGIPIRVEDARRPTSRRCNRLSGRRSHRVRICCCTTHRASRITHSQRWAFFTTLTLAQMKTWTTKNMHYSCCNYFLTMQVQRGEMPPPSKWLCQPLGILRPPSYTKSWWFVDGQLWRLDRSFCDMNYVKLFACGGNTLFNEIHCTKC